MSLRIRRGREEERTGVVFDSGELVVTTDEFRLFVGDGVTVGGRNIAENLGGQGLVFNPNTGKLDATIPSITTDDVTQGVINKYFTNQLAQDAVAAALLAGNADNEFITFSYDDLNNKITAVVSPDGTGITSVQQDTSPTLGGNLTLNTHDIVGVGDINIVGGVTSTLGFVGPATVTDLVSRSSTNIDIASTHYCITDGPNGAWVDVKVAKNTWGNPIALDPSDAAAGIRFNAFDGDVYKITSVLWNIMSPDADFNALHPKSKVTIGVSNNDEPFVQFNFEPSGAFVAPVIQTGVYTTTPTDTRPLGVKGMIIFNDTAGQFEGWNGTNWVALG